MTYDEFMEVLSFEGIEYSWRINGFSISYSEEALGKAIVSGRLPFSLVKLILKDIDNDALKISFSDREIATSFENHVLSEELLDLKEDYRSRPDDFRIDEYTKIIKEYISKKEAEGKEDEMHFVYLFTDNINGLRHIIETISDNNYHNTCLFGEWW